MHWREVEQGDGPDGRAAAIINTTSGAGLVGNFGQTNYATAKAAIAGLTQTLSLELVQAGRHRQRRRPGRPPPASPPPCPARPAVIEPDEVPEDEWNRMDPAVSSPLVAWLASDEADHVTGQVIRAVAEDIILMKGWSDGPSSPTAASGGTPPSSARQLATDVFRTRAPGLRY